jgi:uncharacterized protein YxjI
MDNKIEENTIVKVLFSHDLKISFPKEATLLDLKAQISKSFLIREDEYEIYLGNNSLYKINNKVTLSSLIEKFQCSDFKIKTYKNIFDLKQQLIDYTEYMDNSIKEKEKEIESFKKNYNDLIKDLESINEK